jgi:hypothetical protein
VHVLLNAGFVKHFDTILEVKLENGFHALEFLEGVLFADDAEFSGVAFLNVLKHEYHQFTNEIQHFEVMVFELHLHIKTSELTQVAVGVRVLSTEDRSDLENTLQVTAESHLLVKLRGLSEASILFKVFQSEHVGAAFGRATNELGGVNLNEIFCEKEFAVDLANT